MLYKLLTTVVLALFLVACASGASDEAPVATAEIAADGSTTQGDTPAAEGDAATTDGAATTTDGTTAEEPVATPEPGAAAVIDASAVTTSFLTAYQGENEGADAAQYLDAGLTELFNSGKSVHMIAGIDPTYTSATITNAAPYNDDKTTQVNVQLDYANGVQKIIITLTSSEAGWRIATIAADAQK